MDWWMNGLESLARGIDGKCEQVAQPDAGQAQDEREHGIGGRSEPFAFLRQIQCLQTEGRKGRVASANPQHEKLPKAGGGKPAAIQPGQRREQSTTAAP